MKRLSASILALGLAAVVGSASAQNYGYGDPYDQPYGQQYGQQYGQPQPDRYGQSNGAYYDYARVIRVDPVIDRGYSGYPASGQRCYTRQDGYAANDPYYRNDGYYDQYGNYRNNGYATANGSQGGRTAATIVGGIIGAAIGSQVGGGSARYATSAIGSMVGGMAGRQVYENSHRTYRSGTVQVCDPVTVSSNGGYYNTRDSRVSGYDVTYEYAGRTYVTRTSYHPGNRIRVRVDVRPE